MPPRVLCVVGPTACGKTKLGVLLAQKYHGEVVSVDSMQIYRGMSIGTAAPTAEEMAGIPHYMVGVADPAENWSAARFVQAANRYILDILSRGKLPVLVGGTGLYLDAILSGRTFAPGSGEGAIRRELYARLEREGIGPLVEELRRVDPDAAAKLHPADHKRILRALEVYRETGKTISQHDRETQSLPAPYDPVFIGLAFRDREDMREQINRRVDAMIPSTATALQAIGYKELLPALDGACSMDEAAEEVKLRSRQYAKRQLTWFRRNPSIHWIYWEKGRNFSDALQIATEILTAEGLQ